jgi:hypothetical protein
MKRFFPIFFLMLFILGGQRADAVELISIYSLPLDASADKATDARALAQKQGAVEAVKQALKQIANDPNAVTDTMIASAGIDSRYVYATDILSEKVSAHRYIATVNMHLYAAKVQELAGRLGLGAREEARTTMMVIPFWQDASETWHTVFSPEVEKTLKKAINAAGLILPAPSDPAQPKLRSLTTLPLAGHPVITDLRARYPNVQLHYVAFQPQDTTLHVSVFVPESGGLRTLGELDQPLTTTTGQEPSAQTYQAGMVQALALLTNGGSTSGASAKTSLILNVNIPDVKNRFQAVSTIRTVAQVASAQLQEITDDGLVLNVRLRGESTALQEPLIASGYTLKALDETTWEVGQE